MTNKTLIQYMVIKERAEKVYVRR